MGKSDVRVIFFGELPPSTIHGASISNNINLAILRSKYRVTVIEEFADLKYHDSFSISKGLAFFKSFTKYLLRLVPKSHSIYYGVVYLSKAGICKNILLVFFFKLRNPASKIILHFHRSDISSFLASKLNSFLFFFLNRFVSIYIVLAEKQSEQLRRLGIINTRVLFNTIETEYSDEQLLDISSEEKEEITIIYIRNYIRDKGIFDLIRAVKEYNKNNVRQVVLECYGNFSSSTIHDELMLLSKEIPKVKINSQITGEQKYKTIYESDLTALPSYNEGLPLSLLESMSLGTPMIITNVGFIEEALGTDYPYYCFPDNPQSIIEAIKRYEKDPLKSRLEIKKRYQKFSQKNHAEQVLKIFDE
ncbi:glycosyltransferase family 4 protein [Daejeonella sp.]|uniref:glycosyltransferase family 4 protein n=1 Tax=Daejeonella sp. TaxID=2805397 RepID=UPI002D1FA034|nr:glycosyltransferase family 4 protein [Daejeonella sp.]